MADLSSKSVCITGILPIQRRVAVEMLVKIGGVFTPRVTRSTNILVVGVFPQNRTSTKKYATATKLIEQGYPIVLMSPSEFLSSIEQ